MVLLFLFVGDDLMLIINKHVDINSLNKTCRVYKINKTHESKLAFSI